MKLYLLAVGGIALVAVLLEVVRRRRERLHAPDYVAQVQRWYANDEVQIKPLNLPPVRPLKAHNTRERIDRFYQRLSEDRKRA